MPTVPDIHRRGTRAAQGTTPSPPLTVGTLWFVTDEGVTERWNGTTWDAYSGAGGGGGAPAAHATSHKSGGSDPIALDTLAAPTDVTTLNATTSAHGLLRKLSGVATEVLSGVGTWVPAGGAPSAHATTHNTGGSDPITALAGSVITTGTVAAARLGAHASTHKSGGADPIALDTLAAPTDITTLNASASAHGLLPKLSGASTDFLTGTGIWAVPAGSGGGTPSAHAASHASGGSDPVSVTGLAGYPGGTANFLRADGTFQPPPTGGVPSAHATTHQPGGSDPMAVDAVAATGSLRTLGTGAQQAASGTDSRFTNSRTPTAHASTHVTGGSDVIASAVPAGNAGLMTGADKTKLDGIAAGAEVNVNADWTAVSGDAQILNKPSTFTPAAHASTHNTGGSDPITALAGSVITTGTVAAARLPARTGAIGMQIDGGGSVITTGVKGFIEVPYACTITAATLLSTDSAATAGSIVVDVWKDTYANYPPVVGDSITASAKPTLSSANKSRDTTLTGWTTAVAAGDVIGFSVTSVATLTRVALTLTVTAP